MTGSMKGHPISEIAAHSEDRKVLAGARGGVRALGEGCGAVGSLVVLGASAPRGTRITQNWANASRWASLAVSAAIMHVATKPESPRVISRRGLAAFDTNRVFSAREPEHPTMVPER